MKTLDFFTVPYQSFRRLLIRLRHPISLPEEIARDLGIPISNYLDYQQLTHFIRQGGLTPTKLHKFMARDVAEAAFDHAIKVEKFCRESHFSYCFNDHWMDFTLHFDQNDQLRRLYFHCCGMSFDEQQEILLSSLVNVDRDAH
jgi:hypothetical protein